MDAEKNDGKSDFMKDIFIVMKRIYSACDPEGTDSVKVSQLINFIKPYIPEPDALNCLRNNLDPNNEDVCVTSKFFFDVMNDWALLINASDNMDDEFNRSPSQMDFSNQHLPLNQSTPRTSFGQKLLNNSDFLNFSNVSTYSLGSNKPAPADVSLFEERIKMLQHEINKGKAEMDMMKIQLTNFEDQNELLQIDLNRANKRIQAEQLHNEKLHIRIKEIDELKEDINTYRKKIDDLIKKNNSAEKDKDKLQNSIDELELKINQYKKKYDESCKNEQITKKKLLDLKMEMELKDSEIEDLVQRNMSFNNQLNQCRDIIDYIKCENEQLQRQKDAMEKVLRDEKVMPRYGSPSYVFKSILASNQERFAHSYRSCDVLSSSYASISTPPPTHLWKPRPSENRPEAMSLHRLVLTRSASVQDIGSGFKAESKFMPELPDLNATSPSTSFSGLDDSNASDDSFTIFNNKMRLLTPLFNKRHSLQAELEEANVEVDGKSGTIINEQLIENLREQLKEHDDCPEKIRQYEEEIYNLKMEQESIKEKLNNLEIENDNLRVHILDLEGEGCKTAAEFYGSMYEEPERDESTFSLEGLNLCSDDENPKIRKFLQIIKDLQLHLEKKDKIVEELQEMKDILEISLKKSEDAVASLASDHKNCAIIKNGLFQQMKDIENEHQKIISKYVDEQTKTVKEKYEESTKCLESIVCDLKEQLSSKELTIKNQEEVIKQLNLKKQNLKEDIDLIKELNLKLQTLETKFEHTSNLLVKAQEEIRKKNSIMDKLKDQMEVTSIADINSRLMTLKEEHKNTTEMLLKAQQQLCAKNNEINKQNHKIEENRNFIASLESQLNTQKAENKHINDLLLKAQEKNEEYHKKIILMEDEMNENNKIVDHLIDNLSQSSKETENSLQNRFVRLENLINTLIKQEDQCLNEAISILLKFYKGNDTISGTPSEKVAKLSKLLMAQYQDSLKETENLKAAKQIETVKPIFTEVTCNPLRNRSENNTHKSGSFGKQQARISNLELRLEKSENLLQTKEAKLKQKEEELCSTTKTLRDVEAMLESFKAKETEYNSMISQLKQKISDAEVTVQSSKIKETEYNATIRQLKQQISEAETTVQLSKSKEAEYDSMLHILKQQVSNYEQQINKYKEEIVQLQEREAELNLLKFSHISKLEQQMKQLEVVKAENVKEVRMYQEKIEAYEKQVESLNISHNMNLSLVKINMDKLHNEMSTVKQSYSKVCEENAAMTTHTHNLEEEVSNCHDKIYELTCSLDEVQKSLKSEKSALQLNQEKLKHIETLLENAEKSLDISEKTVEKYHQTNELLNSRTSALSSTYEQFERAINKIISVLRGKCQELFAYNNEFRQVFDAKEDEEVSFCSHIEEHLYKFGILIKKATVVLDIVTVQFEKEMEPILEVENEDVDELPNLQSKSDLGKKYTLRPTRLMTTAQQPVSPDSPSLDIASSLESPDSHGKNWLLISSYEDKISPPNKDLLHMQSFEYEHLIEDLQQPFPNMTDSFLENLGLHETSELCKRSKEELEKMFATLVMQLTIDAKDFEERRERQREECILLNKTLIGLLKEVGDMLLKDRRCICGADTTKPVFIAIRDLRTSTERALVAAARYGVISYEQRMMKCWDLVTNYAAMLRQESVDHGDNGKLSTSPSYTDAAEKNRNRESGQTVPPTRPQNAVAVLNLGPNLLFTIGIILTVSAILFFLGTMAHLHCRLLSLDGEECPLDFLIEKSNDGPPPF